MYRGRVLLLSVLIVAAAPAPFARVKPRTLCLAQTPKDRHLPNAAWVSGRFALTWYEKSGATMEQAVGLLEEVGEPIGESTRAVSVVDGAGSMMGRLACNGSQLGAVWNDDLGGQRTTTFRLLDKTGAPAGEALAVSREFLPHGDQPAVAWNPQTQTWGVLFTGTHPKLNAVTHHKYLSLFRGKPGAPLRMDDAESVSVAHNLALVARGRCFLTAWVGSPGSTVTLGEACEGAPVKRTTVEEKGPGRQQPTLALGADSVLVAWTQASAETAGDDVKLALVDRSGKVSARLTLGGAGLAQSPSLHFDGARFWVTWSERVQDKEQVWLAQVRADGTLADKPVELPGSWEGPVWASFAVSEKRLNVLVSHPNEPACAASFVFAGSR